MITFAGVINLLIAYLVSVVAFDICIDAGLSKLQSYTITTCSGVVSLIVVGLLLDKVCYSRSNEKQRGQEKSKEKPEVTGGVSSPKDSNGEAKGDEVC